LPSIPRIFAVRNTCDGLRNTVTFEQTSIKAQSWTWDFGDGATTSLTTDQYTVSHTYARSGSYKVVLTTTNGQCSVRDSAIAYVLLKQHPLLTASATEVCKGGPLTINITNLEPNPYITGFNNYWLTNVVYGDGSTIPGYNWSSINFPTTYSTTLTNLTMEKKDMKVITRYFINPIGTGGLCYDTTNVIPLAAKGPVTGYQVIRDNVCFNDPAVFKDTSTSVGGTIQKWEWDFGDGQKSTQGGTVSHTYSSPGTYNVSLKVTDDTGCPATGSSSNTRVVIKGPNAAFIASATMVPLTGTVNFSNSTNNGNTSGNTTYTWQIDGVDFATSYSTS
jgi:PKD repeat protein